VQSPSGASEKIFVPHFPQTLITLAIFKGARAFSSIPYQKEN
jgi:hypothetical protein